MTADVNARDPLDPFSANNRGPHAIRLPQWAKRPFFYKVYF